MSKQVSFMGIKSSWSVQQTEHFNSSAQHFQEESDYPSRKDFAVPKSHYPVCFSCSVLKKKFKKNLRTIQTLLYLFRKFSILFIIHYSAGKSPGYASRCHEVIQAQCLDDDTEQAQLLRVLGGDVSAFRSATGARLCDTLSLHPVTVALHAKCLDSLSLWMRRS